MSTRERLLAKTGDLTLPEPAAPPSARIAAPPPADPPVAVAPSAAPARSFPPVVPSPSARTGPGQMLQFRGQLLAAEGELGKLRERLREHEGALPTRRIPAHEIVASRWANRHADAFESAAFLRLRHDIEAAGGNVQPILVRPLAEPAASGARYEIVFGHRRHRACAELGLPVFATVTDEPITELELFSVMDRENRERADLSPYEQGAMYRRALDEKLYPSNRRLAEALGVSHTWVANVLQVADLPPLVLECFRSPLEVQHRHARVIAAALERDRKGVLRRADKVRQQPGRPAAAAVVQALVGTSAEPRAARPAGEAHERPLQVNGRIVGRWNRDATGHLVIRLAPDSALAVDGTALAQALVEVLAAADAAGGRREQGPGGASSA